MDPATDLPDLIEDLEVNIDDLTTTLHPLLPPSSLAKTALPLPLLEKAKLHVLAAYAIESTLFSALLTAGTDAKSHPIFAELARLKGYFAKIKDAEDYFANLAAKENRARVDVGAAQRFIKHGLAGNERYDEMRKERMKREKERALEKARSLTNKKFDDDDDDDDNNNNNNDTPQKRSADADTTPNKRVKLDSSPGQDDDDNEEDEEDEHDGDDGDDDDDDDDDEQDTRKSKATTALGTTPTSPPKKKRGRPSKKNKEQHPATTTATAQDTPTRATRSSAPKTRSEAFQALAARSTESSSAPKKAKSKGKGRGKK